MGKRNLCQALAAVQKETKRGATATHRQSGTLTFTASDILGMRLLFVFAACSRAPLGLLFCSSIVFHFFATPTACRLTITYRYLHPIYLNSAWA